MAQMSDPKKDITRRMPADARREAMLRDAAALFAERGLDISTREIADTLGVTQALIYKHFASKDDLVERTLEMAFAPRDVKSGPWIDPDKPLKDELLRFYIGLSARAGQQRMKLFIRAGLDGRSWPTRRGSALTKHLFLPVISALRRDAGLPGLSETPPMRGERELCMMLHASVVFLGIRQHIYGMEMPDDLSDVVALYVATFLTGAVAAIRDLHADGAASLAVRLAAPNG